MKVEILNVGNEVLTGKVVNTNAAFLSIELEKIGYDVIKIVTVGDDTTELISEIDNFINSNYDVLLTTGGLGPTHDDFTKEVLFDTLGLELVCHKEAVDLLNKYFQGSFAKCNLKQAMYPKNAYLLPNDLGTAMGAVVEHNNKTYGILVGPPFEMQPMVKNYLLPYLEKKVRNRRIVSEYIVMGIGESKVEELLKDYYTEFKDIEIAPYASIGKVRYQLTGFKNEEQRFVIANEKFKELLGEYIISNNNEDIETKVYQELNRLSYKISFAESCTGGMLSSKMINCNGASKVIDISLVTYADKVKEKMLGVNQQTILKYDVVSQQVTEEMARGLYTLTKADVCVSVSGYAGPTGGTEEIPVGSVWFTILINNNMYSEKCYFATSRNVLREKVTMLIYYNIYRILKKL